MLSLGINYSQMHDSSACIARDGELLFAVAEERLTRAKHDARFPALAIKACLDFARVRPDQLDYVAFGWSSPRVTYLHDLADLARRRLPISYWNVLNSTRHFVCMSHQGGGWRTLAHHFGPTKARTLFVDHHLAHAISAYAHSGFAEATALVVDGRGAWEATSIWHGRDGRLEHVLTIPWPNSLGLFYASFTEYLGFQAYSDEWKVMGLAPYGKPGVDLREFITLDHGSYKVAGTRLIGRGSDRNGAIAKVLGPNRTPESEIEDHYKNVA